MRHNKFNNWILLEDGYEHTKDLTKSEAKEMEERYNRLLGDKHQYCIVSYK